MIRSTVYMVIRPERRGIDGRVYGIDIDRITKNKPTRMGQRDIAIKINLDTDERLFMTPEPEVTITLNDLRQVIAPVSADVLDAPEPESDEYVPGFSDDAGDDEP